MERNEYLQLMKFPSEWEEWRMISDEWLEGAMRSYETGMENASEHDRNGAFLWWLKRTPSETQLIKLAKLVNLDPEPLLVGDVKERIRSAKSFTPAVAQVWE